MNIESTTTATARSDSALVKRAQRDDSDAFATLFHTHKMRIYSLCFRMTNNATEAEAWLKTRSCRYSASWLASAEIQRFRHGCTA